MTNGWNGGAPSQFSEPGNQLEMAAKYKANVDIRITGIRVWAGSTASTSGRQGRIWSLGGSLLDSVGMDALLPTTSDYTTYTLADPLILNSGTEFYVSYDTVQYYGAVTNAFPLDSSDGSVTAEAGRFGAARGVFPDTASTAFFGIDIVFDTNTGENQPPVITGMMLNKTDLTVVGTITVTDEIPSTVTAKWEWGDGTSTNTAGGVLTAQHTYMDNGNYAVLVTVTDSDGLKDSEARAVNISVSAETTENEEWLDDIFDAVISDVQRTGYFQKVNGHEPKRAPNTGLTAAVWIQSIEPIALMSGLASTSGRIVFTVRIYSNMLKDPQDAIDPAVMKAVSNIMRRYHDDFDFEGAIRNIDLLGAFGISLSGQAGYLEIDKKEFRIFDITVPCLVNDMWPQIN